MAEIFAETFAISPERVHVTGQPRNDVLVAEEATPPPAEGLPAHRRRILYCPTWREGTQVRLFPFADRDLPGLAEVLEELGAVMYVRTHPNDAAAAASVFEEGGERIVPMQGDVVPEINEVLASFDVLITDYSSVYYDYLMLDRPTIFLPYDVDAYAKAPGFYVPFDEIAAGPRPSTQGRMPGPSRARACATWSTRASTMARRCGCCRSSPAASAHRSSSCCRTQACRALQRSSRTRMSSLRSGSVAERSCSSSGSVCVSYSQVRSNIVS
jgi:hypothetical protein